MSIKCGFFDAENFTEEIIEGQTVLVPDRAYSPSDFNTYLQGIISDSGAFYANAGKIFTVEVMDDSTIDPEEPGYTANCFKVVIHPGKGRINGCFVEIPDQEILWVPHGNVSGKRYDRIVLRLDESSRDITAELIMGRYIEDGLPSADSLNDTEYYRFDAETHEEGKYDIGIAQICILESATTSDKVKNEVTSLVGGDDCPWITHLVYGKAGQDDVVGNLDVWLNQYAQRFKDWFTNVVDNLEVSTTIVKYNAVLTEGNKWTLSEVLAPSGYEYNGYDVFNVYYNGLRLKPGEYILNNDAGTIALAKGDIAPNNELYLEVLKNQVGIPEYLNGDNEKY